MPQESRSRRILEISTAVLLGLVSVATAVGAYQASEWSRQAGAYASIGNQLRDETFASSIAMRVAAFDDNQRVGEALAIEFEIMGGASNVDELRAEQGVVLSGGSAGLVDEWSTWVESGYSDDAFPMTGHAFQAAGLAPTYGANRASTVAFRLSDELGSRGLHVAVAASIFALALLLLGVSGANRSFRVALALAGGGAGAFVVGVVISVLAVVG